MNIMFLLLGISLFVALIFLIIFIATVRSGQYDDMYTPSVRILFDNEDDSDENSTETNESKTTKK